MENQQLANVLPAHKVAAVEKALQSAFHTTTVESITPLAGGLSTALVYKIVVNGTPYVLRVIMHIDPLSDPVRQYTCMRLAADAGIAPPVYYADAADALAITGYIERVPLLQNFGSIEALLVALAQTVKAIHATPLFPKLVNFMDGVDGFIANFKTAQWLPVDALAEHLHYYAQIQQHYPRHDLDAIVSSHNDLNYNNLLFDGTKIWVIDWETAFQADRFVDLANLANAFVTTPAQEAIYLRAYFGDNPHDDGVDHGVDETKRARLFLMQQTCRFFYAMIMLQIADAHLLPGQKLDADMTAPRYGEFRQMLAAGQVQLDTAVGQLLFAKTLLNEALHDMQSERFAHAIAHMQTLRELR